MEIVRKQMSYKYFGTESCKVLNVSISSIHTFLNGQCSCPFIFSKDGGTHNKVLSDINKEIWDCLLAKGITITAECLPVAINKEAGFHLRAKRDSSEWELDHEVFQTMCRSRIFQTQIFLLPEFLIMF